MAMNCECYGYRSCLRVWAEGFYHLPIPIFQLGHYCAGALALLDTLALQCPTWLDPRAWTVQCSFFFSSLLFSIS